MQSSLVYCSACGQKYTLPPALLLTHPRQFKCPKCQYVNPIPDSIIAEEASPPEPSSKIVISFDSVVPPALSPDSSEIITAVVVQPQTASSASPTPQRKQSPWERRLTADERDTLEFFKDFPLISILSRQGTPAQKYIVEYHVRGIERVEKDAPVYRDVHQVEITLGREYPRMQPTCRMLTPIFHPNIEPAVICIGDHWTAQERLHHLIVRIGEIITYQSYNIHSPLDGLAARWADLHPNLLPTDSRFLMPDFG